MSIKENIAEIERQVPPDVKLVAVTKTKPIAMLQEAYDTGCKIFGENKAQEMVEKYEALPKDIQWHMIGHLQTNKVKYLAPFVSLIHSVDSLKVLKEINKQAKKNDRTIDCLLQIHIAEEDTKFGLSEEEVVDLLDSKEFDAMENVQVSGLMGMATWGVSDEQLRREFGGLRQLFEKLKEKETEKATMQVLSMGMSNDFPVALEEGSTMVRVGSAIFGARK
ncbi:YggS family pyridoxal phosphate-dependent enzyme [Persicitalea sp.]|uniref:YggS family pyridoxal phosphate-dependent enzyme n=1 Tax=Persicitalea sp. TaxID=3100273 RepID=UPI0035934B90